LTTSVATFVFTFPLLSEKIVELSRVVSPGSFITFTSHFLEGLWKKGFEEARISLYLLFNIISLKYLCAGWNPSFSSWKRSDKERVRHYRREDPDSNLTHSVRKRISITPTQGHPFHQRPGRTYKLYSIPLYSSFPPLIQFGRFAAVCYSAGTPERPKNTWNCKTSGQNR